MDAAIRALWVEDASLLPPGYADMVLCRTFGWTPSELDEQDAGRIEMLVALMSAENIVKARRERVNAERAQRKGGRGAR